MSGSTARGLRLLKAMETYKTNVRRWDTVHVLDKVEIESIRDGTVTGKLRVEEHMCNSAGTLHGGYTATLLDVLAMFAFCAHPRGNLAFTTALDLRFLGKASCGETVRVEARSLAATSGGALVACEVRGETPGDTRGSQGALLAHATAALQLASPRFLERAAEILPFDAAPDPPTDTEETQTHH